MSITIDTAQLKQAAAQLRDLPKQVRNAVLTAIDRTAQRVAEAERAEMRDVFDRPTPFTLRSIYLRNTRLPRDYAEVGVADTSAGMRPPVSWLRWQIYGGTRTQTALERRLAAAGAMQPDMRAVPGKFARLDAYGNISPGQIRQILSQLRIELSAGATSVLPRMSASEKDALRSWQGGKGARAGMSNRQRSLAKDAQAKSRRIQSAYRRSGGQFVSFPNGRGKLLPGIYQVRDFAFGRASPKPVLIFVSKAAYEAGRFDFHYVAKTVAARALQSELDRSMASIKPSP